MILVIELILLLLFPFVVIGEKDDEQMDAFFKYARTSGACIENYLTLMNKHMSAEERAHWEEISLLNIKDFEAFVKDFDFDHANNEVVLKNLEMERLGLDVGDNDDEMRFKFYIFDGFRYSFTPNGRVLPQNMAKIAFMIHWQKLRLTKDKRNWSWKFIDYHVITENLSKLGNELGKTYNKLKGKEQNRVEKNDVKKDVYLCDLLKIALSPPTMRKETGKSKLGTSKQHSVVDVREDFRKMFEKLNKKQEETKLRSLVTRWEQLERYKYWNNICSTMPKENGQTKVALEKFANHFSSIIITPEGRVQLQFQTYNQMRNLFNEYEWNNIVKSYIYPALEFYVHKQQKFDTYELSEIPALISLCISQMESKRKKLNFGELKKRLPGPWFANDKFGIFVKAMLDKWKPSWLETAPVGEKNPHHLFLNHRFDLNRLVDESMFMPIEEMDHKHISHLFDIQKKNNWKNSAESIDAYGNVHHSFEDTNLVESFLKIYPNMYKKSKKTGKQLLKMNMDYFIGLTKRIPNQLGDRFKNVAGKQSNVVDHFGGLHINRQLPKNVEAWLSQCLEAYLLLRGKESVDELDGTEQINFLFQTNLRIFHRLQNEAKQQQLYYQQPQYGYPNPQQSQAPPHHYSQQPQPPPPHHYSQPAHTAYSSLYPPPPAANPAYPNPSHSAYRSPQAYPPHSAYPHPHQSSEQIPGYGYPNPQQSAAQHGYGYHYPPAQSAHGAYPPAQSAHGYHYKEQQAKRGKRENYLMEVLDKLGRDLVKALVIINKRNESGKEEKIKNCEEVSNEISYLQNSYNIKKEQMEEILAWTKKSMTTILSHRTSDLSSLFHRQECIEQLNVFQSLWKIDIQQKYETNFAQDLLNLFDISENKSETETFYSYDGKIKEQHVVYRGKDGYKINYQYNFEIRLGKQIKELKNDKHLKEKVKIMIGWIDTKLWMHAEGQFEILLAKIAERNFEAQEDPKNKNKYLGFANYELKEVYAVQLAIHILLAGIFALNRQMREAIWADTIDGTSKFQEIKFIWVQLKENNDNYGHLSRVESSAGTIIQRIHGLEIQRKMVQKLNLLGLVLNDFVQQYKYGEWTKKKIEGLGKKPINVGNRDRDSVRGSVQALAVKVDQMTTQKEKLNQIFAEMSWKSRNVKKKKDLGTEVAKWGNHLTYLHHLGPSHVHGKKKGTHKKKKKHGEKEEEEEEGEGEEEEEEEEEEQEEGQDDAYGEGEHFWETDEGADAIGTTIGELGLIADAWDGNLDGDFGLSLIDFPQIDFGDFNFDLGGALSNDWADSLGEMLSVVGVLGDIVGGAGGVIVDIGGALIGGVGDVIGGVGGLLVDAGGAILGGVGEVIVGVVDALA